MNTRLKIICILFGTIYFYIIGEYVVTEAVSEFTAGFKEGFNEGRNAALATFDNLPMEYKTCFLNAIPQKGLGAYPISFTNLKNSSAIHIAPTIFRAKVENPVKLPTWINIAYGFEIFFAFIILFLLIYIPVQAYKTICSIVKNKIFEEDTVYRIRRIGYALLIVFGLGVYTSVVSYFESKALISLEEYKIVFSVKENYIFLLFGLITLLFAEILKMSHKMKIEQDLTI
jgi:hypothetical protein